jgi:hypothetical protein
MLLLAALVLQRHMLAACPVGSSSTSSTGSSLTCQHGQQGMTAAVQEGCWLQQHHQSCSTSKFWQVWSYLGDRQLQ